jgi:hypothetical protein
MARTFWKGWRASRAAAAAAGAVFAMAAAAEGRSARLGPGFAAVFPCGDGAERGWCAAERLTAGTPLTLVREDGAAVCRATAGPTFQYEHPTFPFDATRLRLDAACRGPFTVAVLGAPAEPVLGAPAAPVALPVGALCVRGRATFSVAGRRHAAAVVGGCDSGEQRLQVYDLGGGSPVLVYENGKLGT